MSNTIPDAAAKHKAATEVANAAYYAEYVKQQSPDAAAQLLTRLEDARDRNRWERFAADRTDVADSIDRAFWRTYGRDFTFELTACADDAALGAVSRDWLRRLWEFRLEQIEDWKERNAA